MSLWDYGTGDLAATGSNPYSVTRSGFTSFSPFAVGTFGALPVTWLSISGHHENNNNYISWSTASEDNSDYFAVEVSTNATNFTEIGRVAASGTTPFTHNYSFVHYNAVSPVLYYRIRQVDLDGKYSYSKTIKISAAEILLNSVLLTPDPVIGNAAVQIHSTRSSNLYFNVLDISGKMIYSKMISVQAGVNDVEINMAGKSAGIYVLKVCDNTGYSVTKQFIKK